MKSNLAIDRKSQLQGELFAPLSVVPAPSASKKARSGAFGDNMKMPVHRWFRYSAGFSAEWAKKVISDTGISDCEVLDPFAGSGTTLIAAQEVGAFGVGFEAHPFVARIAAAKMGCQGDPDEFMDAVDLLLDAAARQSPIAGITVPPLLTKCYTPEALTRLYALRSAFDSLKVGGDVKALLWLLITAILRECSYVGTAQWQYVLPNKTKARSKEPFAALRARASDMYGDMKFAQQTYTGSSLIIEADARAAPLDEYRNFFDIVVTSPPYPNNYDYADATRLEMSFWGEIGSWGDLHRSVRHKLICSCSQHSSAEKMELDELLENPLLAPIRQELEIVCRSLETVKDTKGGKKAYHTMIAAYFTGLAEVWQSLRPMMKDGSTLYFVVGDSAPYGVHAPCEVWLGKLALAAGFKSFDFEKLRDRNTKWKNRKHTVLLKEGILRVRG